MESGSKKANTGKVSEKRVLVSKKSLEKTSDKLVIGGNDVEFNRAITP